jgi:two-component system KDP operon response regulator KdpE
MKTKANLRRLLYVDDNPQMRRALARSLTLSGFNVVTATDGADGAFQFHSHDGGFDCVLTDHDLSDGTGAEFSELLRESGFKGRIIVFSGPLTEKDQALYEKSAIAGFFLKPFKLQTLVDTLLKESRRA